MSATGEALKARGLRFKAEYVMEDKLPSGPPTGFYPDWMRGFWQMPIIGPQPDRWESSGDWETDCRATIGEAQRQAHEFIEQLQRSGSTRDPMPAKENYCFDMNAPDYKRELAKAFLKLSGLVGDGYWNAHFKLAEKHGIDLGVLDRIIEII